MANSILSEVIDTSILRNGVLHPAIPVLSTRYRPLASCLPRSGLERSDFVLWPLSTDRHHRAGWSLLGYS